MKPLTDKTIRILASISALASRHSGSTEARPRPRRPVSPALILVCVLAAWMLAAGMPGAAAGEEQPLPEFADRTPARWINSPPLSREDLRGDVVLVEIWTSV